MEKKRIALGNGERYAYSDMGAGECVVLIHGNMSSSVHYAPIVDALAKKYRVIAPDLRGFGDSSYVNRFDSLKELASDVRIMCGLLGITRAHVVGWSAGGGVAMELAAVAPELVMSLSLIEGAPHDGFPIYKKDDKGMPIVGSAYGSKAELASDPVQVAPMQAMLESGNAAGMAWVWDKTIYTAKKPTPEQSEMFIDETMKQRCLIDLDYALATINMGHGFNGYSDGDGGIDKILCPCLITACGKDIVVPTATAKANAAAIGDNAVIVEYPQAGHSPLVDCPNELANDLLEFFKGVENGGNR